MEWLAICNCITENDLKFVKICAILLLKNANFEFIPKICTYLVLQIYLKQFLGLSNALNCKVLKCKNNTFLQKIESGNTLIYLLVTSFNSWYFWVCFVSHRTGLFETWASSFELLARKDVALMSYIAHVSIRQVSRDE